MHTEETFCHPRKSERNNIPSGSCSGKWAKLGMVLREKVWKSKKMRRWYDVVERKGFNYRGWNMLFEETNSPRYALYFWRYITYSYGIFSIRYS